MKSPRSSVDGHRLLVTHTCISMCDNSVSDIKRRRNIAVSYFKWQRNIPVSNIKWRCNVSVSDIKNAIIRSCIRYQITLESSCVRYYCRSKMCPCFRYILTLKRQCVWKIKWPETFLCYISNNPKKNSVSDIWWRLNVTLSQITNETITPLYQISKTPKRSCVRYQMALQF